MDIPYDIQLHIFQCLIPNFPTKPTFTSEEIADQFLQRGVRLNALLVLASVCKGWRKFCLAERNFWVDIPANSIGPTSGSDARNVLFTWTPRSPPHDSGSRAVLSLKEYVKSGTHFHLRRIYDDVIAHYKGRWAGFICEGDSFEFLKDLERRDFGQQAIERNWNMPGVRYLELSQNPGRAGGVQPCREEVMLWYLPLAVFPNLRTLRILHRSWPTMPNFKSPHLERIEAYSAPSGNAWFRKQLQLSPNVHTIINIEAIDSGNSTYPTNRDRIPTTPLPHLREYQTNNPSEDIICNAPDLERFVLWQPRFPSQFFAGNAPLMKSIKAPCFEVVLTSNDFLSGKSVLEGICQTVFDGSKEGETLERLEIDASRVETQEATQVLRALIENRPPQPKAKHVTFKNVGFSIEQSRKLLKSVKENGLKELDLTITLHNCSATRFEGMTDKELGIWKNRQSRSVAVADIVKGSMYEVVKRLVEAGKQPLEKNLVLEGAGSTRAPRCEPAAKPTVPSTEPHTNAETETSRYRSLTVPLFHPYRVVRWLLDPLLGR
jgi:hypothetical protein